MKQEQEKYASSFLFLSTIWLPHSEPSEAEIECIEEGRHTESYRQLLHFSVERPESHHQVQVHHPPALRQINNLLKT